jgi:hypothetical protein
MERAMFTETVEVILTSAGEIEKSIGVDLFKLASLFRRYPHIAQIFRDLIEQSIKIQIHTNSINGNGKTGKNKATTSINSFRR